MQHWQKTMTMAQALNSKLSSPQINGLRRAYNLPDPRPHDGYLTSKSRRIGCLLVLPRWDSAMFFACKINYTTFSKARSRSTYSELPDFWYMTSRLQNLMKTHKLHLWRMILLGLARATSYRKSMNTQYTLHSFSISYSSHLR